MEVLFENNLIRNRDVLNTFYAYFYFKTPLSIVIFSICGLSVILQILSYIFWWDIDILITTEFIPLFIAIPCILYSRSVTNTAKRDKEQFGTDSLLVTTSITKDSLQCTYGELQAAPVALDQIKKIVVTKKLILMFSKAKLCYILDKNNFTIGTYDDFIPFLRSKGLKVRGA